MGISIFIPKKINVGFQNRDGTYTGQLAYVTYFDENGKLRKERSWEGWRNKDIPNKEFDNKPVSGIVLNKKAGGYSSGWNHRNTYARIYDCRGFEFEITMENLLYILEHTNSIKGKALEGEFVYGWSSGDHILIPTSSPDYEDLKKFNENKFNPKSFKGKDMKIGGTYLSKDNKELVYMGRFMCYNNYKKDKKEYFFYNRDERFITYTTLTKNIIDVVSEECVKDYSDIFSKRLEYYERYNPYDESKDEYINHTLSSFKKYVLEHKLSYREYTIIKYFKNNKGETKHYCYEYPYEANYYPKEKLFKWRVYEDVPTGNFWNKTKSVYTYHKKTIEEFFNEFKPQYKKEYLKDGKLRGVRCYEKK